MIKGSTLIVILRISICCGICLILLGIYLHNFNHTVEAMGIKGIILSAMCVAFGMIMSLPTKMYLTLLLVNHENHQRELEHSHQHQHPHTHSNQNQYQEQHHDQHYEQQELAEQHKPKTVKPASSSNDECKHSQSSK